MEPKINLKNKSKSVNFRISAPDLEKIKQRAAEEGMPYQTLISSIIHKFITGTLVDEKAVLQAMRLLGDETRRI